MATIQEQIATIFLEKLSASGDVEADKVAKFRELMRFKRKISPDDIIAIFASSSGDVK
jgi:hypothetical protein